MESNTLEGIEIEIKGRIHVPFMEAKAVGDTGEFGGYAATFSNIDLGRDICEVGCFDETVAEHAKADSMPGLYYGHDMDEVIGDWLDWSINGKGLPMKGRLWIGQGIPRADQEYLRLKSKGPKGLSIGYRTKRYVIDAEKKVRRLQAVQVVESSLVPMPMNPKATITSVKSCLLVDGCNVSKRQAEHILREVGGFSQSEAKAQIAKTWDALMGTSDQPRDAAPDTEAIAAIANEMRRTIAAMKL